MEKKNFKYGDKVQDIPYQSPKQAKYSEQYRRLIANFKRIQMRKGHSSSETERAFKRLKQAQAIVLAVCY